MLATTALTHYHKLMSETLPESEGQVEKLGLQKAWDLAAELIKEHGKSDEDYGIMSVTWTYGAHNESIFIEAMPGGYSYGGGKMSPYLTVLFGTPGYRDFDTDKEFTFDAVKTDRTLFGHLAVEDVNQIYVKNRKDRTAGNQIPTEVDIAELESILSFALADLNNQKRRQVTSEHLAKSARQLQSLESKNGELEYLKTWLSSVIEEYDPAD